MIISHKYRFICIKTGETAGTSIEAFLSHQCGPENIVTPIFPHVEPHVARNFTGYFNPLPELCIFRGKGVSGTVIDFLRKQRFYRRRLLENSFFRSYYRYIARKYEPRFAKYGYSLIKDCGIDDSILRERGLISDAIGALCCTGADMYAFLRRFALRVRCLIKRQIKRVLPELVLAKIRKVRDVRSRRRKGSDRRMDLGYRKPAVRN